MSKLAPEPANPKPLVVTSKCNAEGDVVTVTKTVDRKSGEPIPGAEREVITECKPPTTCAIYSGIAKCGKGNPPPTFVRFRSTHCSPTDNHIVLRKTELRNLSSGEFISSEEAVAKPCPDRTSRCVERIFGNARCEDLP